MPITPDLPFPKSAGDSIRSKDWNDLVSETRRLDTAKVDRAGDAITGPLSVAGALAIGKSSAAATAKLDVAGSLSVNDFNLLLRAGNDINHGLGWFGTGKLFAGANIDGPVLWGNAGGALGTVPGGAQQIALSWDNAGRIAIGVPSTELKVDIGDRIRLREGPAGSAGLWLYQTTPAEDRAFIGMASDNRVGLFGKNGAGWSLSMDVTLGTVGVRVAPHSVIAHRIDAGVVGSSPALTYGLYVTGATTYAIYAGGNTLTNGRARDSKLRVSTGTNGAVSTTSATWVDVPNLSMTITSPDIGAFFDVRVHINGVQGTLSPNIRGYFRLLVDGSEWERTAHEFNNAGWELRGVVMNRLISLNAGNHTLAVQWLVQGTTGTPTLTCCWYNDMRLISAVEL